MSSMRLQLVEPWLKAEREAYPSAQGGGEDEYRGLKRFGDVLVAYRPLARLDEQSKN